MDHAGSEQWKRRGVRGSCGDTGILAERNHGLETREGTLWRAKNVFAQNAVPGGFL